MMVIMVMVMIIFEIDLYYVSSTVLIIFLTFFLFSIDKIFLRGVVIVSFYR